MSKTDRHDELVALLRRIADTLDGFRGAPDLPTAMAANLEAIKHEAETPMRGHGECCEPDVADDGLAEWERELFRPDSCCGKCPPIAGGGFDCACEGNPRCAKADTPEEWHPEPAPADDLPGEPVEPGDLRAGDRVAFTWGDECITSTLVSSYDGDALYSGTPRPSGYTPNVVWDGEWAGGISDVRLIERAPREDEHDPDEALAEALRKAYSTGDWLDVARVARERIEAEQEDAVSFLREEVESLTARAEKAERALDNATQRVLDLTAERDKWNTLAHEADRNAKRHHDRAEKAEAERDEWKARHEALREDVETRWAFVDDNFLKDILHSILKGDDERAKGEQR